MQRIEQFSSAFKVSPILYNKRKTCLEKIGQIQGEVSHTKKQYQSFRPLPSCIWPWLSPFELRNHAVSSEWSSGSTSQVRDSEQAVFFRRQAAKVLRSSCRRWQVEWMHVLSHRIVQACRIIDLEPDCLLRVFKAQFVCLKSKFLDSL